MGQVIPIPTALPAWLDAELWQDWQQHRIELGRPLTPTAQRRCLRKLETWHDDPEVDETAQLEHCIEMGWRGLWLADLSKQNGGKPPRMMSDADLIAACSEKGIGTKGKTRRELEQLV